MYVWGGGGGGGGNFMASVEYWQHFCLNWASPAFHQKFKPQHAIFPLRPKLLAYCPAMMIFIPLVRSGRQLTEACANIMVFLVHTVNSLHTQTLAEIFQLLLSFICHHKNFRVNAVIVAYRTICEATLLNCLGGGANHIQMITASCTQERGTSHTYHMTSEADPELSLQFSLEHAHF